MKLKSSSTHKKVVVETFDGQRLPGYVNLRQFDQPESLLLLDPAGEMQQLPWKNVKVAWFVRDWEEPPARPDRLVFQRRPRLEGLWVRLRLRDNEVLEGVIVNDLLQMSPHGYLFTPPDLNGSHQKAFVPRAALAAMEVLAVVPNRGQHHPR
ncbi:MAG: hypothetical protein HYY26_05580, partial [Acidobacteria bacterium]|nr:hypothetical protein [Acidobacteriota bacterium]